MYRHRFTKLLLLPSLFSSIVSSVVAIAMIIGVNWALILDNLPFYDYFFGNDGTVTNLQGPTNEISAAGEVLDSKALLVLGGVLLAGVGLVIVVRGIVGLINSISWTMQEMHAVDGPAKRAVERELGARAGTRALVAVVWTGYVFVWIKIILPFCILASQLGFSSSSSVSEGIGYVFFALGLLLVSLHLHVIIARLLLLRPRVFGGDEALLVNQPS
jgi:hypothetical protein